MAGPWGRRAEGTVKPPPVYVVLLARRHCSTRLVVAHETQRTTFTRLHCCFEDKTSSSAALSL
jgi:hypothetical protein